MEHKEAGIFALAFSVYLSYFQEQRRGAGVTETDEGHCLRRSSGEECLVDGLSLPFIGLFQRISTALNKNGPINRRENSSFIVIKETCKIICICCLFGMDMFCSYEANYKSVFVLNRFRPQIFSAIFLISSI